MLRAILYTSLSLTFLLTVDVHAAQKLQKTEQGLIEELTGIKGKYNDTSGVFRVSSPRKDLEASANGIKLTTTFGLTSWAAFKQVKKGTQVVANIVLTEGQVDPVMKVALNNGLKVTSLHNEPLIDSPKVLFMRLEAVGTLHELASAVNKVFQETNNTTNNVLPAKVQIDVTKSTLDTKKIDDSLHRKGTVTDGVYKINRSSTTKLHGQEIDADMGVNSWAAMAGSEEQAVILGDFTMKEDDVQNVLKSLLKSKMQVLSINNRMMDENPRMAYVRFWGTGTAKDLTAGLKDALMQVH